MSIKDYKFSYRQLNHILWECLIVNSEGTRFGILIQVNGQPKDELIFDLFKNKFNQFFIDVDLISLKPKETKKAMVLKK